MDRELLLEELIQELRVQNAYLVERNTVLEKQVLELREENRVLRNRVTELERQLKANSQNSSKPPSGDGLKKPPKNTSLRPKGTKGTGGQPGHKGSTLNAVAKPDKVVIHGVNVCSSCSTDLVGVPLKRVIKRQVFDIPKPELYVTEHQVEVKSCPCCQQEVQGRFPSGVNAPVQCSPWIM